MWQMFQALFVALVLTLSLLISGSLGSKCSGDDVVAALSGPPGPPGPSGAPGPSLTVYTVWGKRTCPTTPGTKLVYSGIAAKNRWNEIGGGIDYQCMSNSPLYLSASQSNGKQLPRAAMLGTQFENWVGNYNTNPATSTFETLPCAVCLTGRSTSIMIPGRYKCPDNFRREYYGNLGAERSGHKSSSTYICLAHDRDTLPNDKNAKNETPDSTVMLAEIQAGGSRLTPPYEDGKEVSCAVCTI